MVKSNPNKIRRMNNGGSWIYKEGKKKKTLQILVVISRLHIFFSEAQGGHFGSLPLMEVSNPNAENPLIRIQISMLAPKPHELCHAPFWILLLVQILKPILNRTMLPTPDTCLVP